MLQVDDRRSTLEKQDLAPWNAHLSTIERVIRTMREHLCEAFSLEDMADVACLSPYYFSRVFHQIIGTPPGEFLATLRLDMAKRLLLTTPMSVTDICFEVGYSALGSTYVTLRAMFLRRYLWRGAFRFLCRTQKVSVVVYSA